MRLRAPSGSVRGGFTLLEVLVAMTILATSLVVLLQNVSTSIWLSNISRDMTVAAMIAQDKMTELELEDTYSFGTSDGDFEDKYPGFWWSVSVSESMFPNTAQIDLGIFWGNPEDPERIILTSFIPSEGIEGAPAEEEEGADDDDADTDSGSEGTTTDSGSTKT